MTHRAKVCATYRIGAYELVQAIVSVESSYPDALDEAKVVACATVKAMVDDAYARERVAVQADE